MPNEEVESLAKDYCRILYQHVGGAWIEEFWFDMLSEKQREGWRLIARTVLLNYMPKIDCIPKEDHERALALLDQESIMLRQARNVARAWEDEAKRLEEKK